MQNNLGVKCPNHGCPLVDCSNGIGICPISGARFSYSADDKEKKEKLRINAFGNVEQTKNWEVKHVSGEDI